MLDKEWLKITRIRLNLTLEEVAEEMFVTKQTLSNIETGKSTKKSTMLFYKIILEKHINEVGGLRKIF